ncbi:hypothetical protein K7432_008989 [Basidiobolus ranarum]|uniref:Tc toxin complex TcA C-terminal TcB-binding domain-containing protein n=1 Tax=Basidiobolus ranarum TaxID=34480 RepID=A0ABR2VXW4_9FUNG
MRIENLQSEDGTARDGKFNPQLSSELPKAPQYPPISLADTTHACYDSGRVLLVLNTDEINPLSLNNVNFEQDMCLIYSEVVSLSSSKLSLPGKKIGIFCNQFILPTVQKPTDKETTADKSVYTIDVSGTDKLKETGAGKDGENGVKGGSIWLYVQSMSYDVANRIRLVANGGGGGDGGDLTGPSAVTHRGGKGGEGGQGGYVGVYYGYEPQALRLLFPSFNKLNWAHKVAELVKNNLFQKCSGVPTISSDDLKQVQKSLESHQEFLNSANGLITQLSSLADTSSNPMYPTPEEETIKVAATCGKAIESVLSAKYGPVSLKDGSLTKEVTALATSIKEWLDQGGGTSDEDNLRKNMAAVTSYLLQLPAQDRDDSELEQDLQIVSDGLTAACSEVESKVRHTVASANGGLGGAGGSSYKAEIPYGSHGGPGSPGAVESISLYFNGREEDIAAMTQVCVFPDQCQMLLNQADRNFFQNSKESIEMAGILYSRLVKRLSFVPTLYPLSGKQSPKTENLAKAYDYIENVYGLSFTCAQQLTTILTQAQTRLNYLLQGADMFGNFPNWVPRLSYEFYKGEVMGLLEYLQKLQTSVASYSNARQDAQKVEAAITVAIASNRNMKAQADASISLLTGSNGMLEESALKISLYTPILKAKRADLKVRIQAVQSALQNVINMDPQTVLDAFASVAMAPSNLFADATALANFYKAYSNVTDIQGNQINREYIISQLKSCEKTFKSLSEAYSVNKDGSYAVDDPGALKIIASQSAMEDLVSQYRNAIPKEASELEKSFDDYVNTINQRNGAVLKYNLTLQALVKAKADSDYYDCLVQKLSAQKLMLNPTLPFIYYWMDRLVNNCQLDIMRRLNCSGRAIRFWGLTTQGTTMTSPGPLRGYIDLFNNQTSLTNLFGNCLSDMATSVWNYWPASHSGETGLLYDFTGSELSAIRKANFDADKKTKLHGIMIHFNENSPTFAGLYNLRLNQVRVWLPGAKTKADSLDRQLLHISIKHMGREKIKSKHGEVFDFDHSAVSLQYIYDAAQVKSVKDIKKPKIDFSKQSIENDYTGGQATPDKMAPLGPLTTWWIQISDADNPGLDLGDVQSAHIEFWGRNQ